MNYISIFIISFAIALSGALAPGPLLTCVIYESTRKGAKAGPLITLGHAILELAMVALIILGLANLINNSLVLKIISGAGVIIFIYFGSKMIISIPKLSLDTPQDYKSSSNLALTGITMSLVNPYWAIWWLTIGLGLVLTAQKIGWIGIFVFFIGHILADLIWYTIVSLTISRGKKFFSLKIYKGIILVCGALLIGFGVWFAVKLI